jgi:hypothetical protein
MSSSDSVSVSAPAAAADAEIIKKEFPVSTVRLDAATGLPVYKMNVKSIYFGNAKHLVNSVQERFNFRFSSTKNDKSGYYPLELYPLSQGEVPIPIHNIQVVFPLQYHTLVRDTSENNPYFSEDKPSAHIVPIVYNGIDADFLLAHQKDEEGFLLDAYNALVSRMFLSLVQKDENTVRKSADALEDIKIRFAKGFDLEGLVEAAQDDKKVALEVRGGWVMNDIPKDILTNPTEVTTRVGITWGVYRWHMHDIKAPRVFPTGYQKPSSSGNKRKQTSPRQNVSAKKVAAATASTQTEPEVVVV